jgi:hypothetical protein
MKNQVLRTLITIIAVVLCSSARAQMVRPFSRPSSIPVYSISLEMRLDQWLTISVSCCRANHRSRIISAPIFSSKRPQVSRGLSRSSQMLKTAEFSYRHQIRWFGPLRYTSSAKSQLRHSSRWLRPLRPSRPPSEPAFGLMIPLKLIAISGSSPSRF